MPRLRKNQLPSMRWSGAHRQFVVDLSRQRHYLGGEQADAAARYDQLVQTWIAGGRQPLKAARDEPVDTVADLIRAYLEWLSSTHRKRGRETTHVEQARLVLRKFEAIHGRLALSEVTARHMRQWGDWLARHPNRQGGKLARSTIRMYTSQVRLAFQWGVTRSLVSAAVLAEVAAPLTHGRVGEPRESVKPPPEEDVEAATRETQAHVAAMIRLMRATGMRPAELCGMRPCDVDRSGPVWVYRVHHDWDKTIHHDEHAPRVVPIGPRAQALLAPWLDRCRQPEDFVWTTRTGRQISVSYLWYLVARACDAAGVDRWSPNQLRHARATELRARYGIEAAQVTLGHSRLQTTEIYAERSLSAAIRIAAESG